jgi:hypothetical protein
MNRLSGLAGSALIGLCAQAFACGPNEPEDFSGFFTKFADNKTFAMARTVYPVVTVNYEYGIEDGKQQITEVRRHTAKQDDMKYPPLADFLTSMGLESRHQDVSRTGAVVEVFKPGSNGLLTYHFALAGGCWFLREIQNHRL